MGPGNLGPKVVHIQRRLESKKTWWRLCLQSYMPQQSNLQIKPMIISQWPNMKQSTLECRKRSELSCQCMEVYCRTNYFHCSLLETQVPWLLLSSCLTTRHLKEKLRGAVQLIKYLMPARCFLWELLLSLTMGHGSLDGWKFSYILKAPVWEKLLWIVSGELEHNWDHCVERSFTGPSFQIPVIESITVTPTPGPCSAFTRE